MLVSHAGIRPFICDVCGTSFVVKSKLKVSEMRIDLFCLNRIERVMFFTLSRFICRSTVKNKWKLETKEWPFLVFYLLSVWFLFNYKKM